MLGRRGSGAAHGEGRGNGGEGAALRTVRGGGMDEDLGFQLILYYVITITAVGSKMDGQK